MYIELDTVFWVVIGISSVVALVFLILTLNNICKLVKNVNGLLEKNSENINKLCDTLPSITENVESVVINAKDISDVATEITADAIVAKDNFTNHYGTLKDIVDILVNVFMKK